MFSWQFEYFYTIKNMCSLIKAMGSIYYIVTLTIIMNLSIHLSFIFSHANINFCDV